MTRFECVDAQNAAGFPVSEACAAVDVSTSGFYDWRNRRDAGPTDRQLADEELIVLIRQIHKDSDGNYGQPRILTALRKAGVVINHKKVTRLMRKAGVVGRYTPPKKRTTIPGELAVVVPDLVGRNYTPGVPDAAWVQDITYIATREGWLYLAGVVDLGSRRMIGYSMKTHMRTELVLDALTMALATRSRTYMGGTIAHSDHGTQYTSYDYYDYCTKHGLRPSAGSIGDCFDNSVAESFWATLKRECVKGRIYTTRAEARQEIFAFISRYNRQRIHTSLGGLTPTEWEDTYPQAA